MKNENRKFTPRKLARSVAKANMKKAGVPHVNWLFAHSWRDYVIVK